MCHTFLKDLSKMAKITKILKPQQSETFPFIEHRIFTIREE